MILRVPADLREFHLLKRRLLRDSAGLLSININYHAIKTLLFYTLSIFFLTSRRESDIPRSSKPTEAPTSGSKTASGFCGNVR